MMDLLRAGDERALNDVAVNEPQAVRFLLGRLWDPDEAIQRRAARTIGVAAASHPEIGVDLLRRFMWGINDESATNGVCGIPAIGEIGFQSPEIAAPFVAPLASVAWDDGLRLEIIRALSRIAEAAPELVKPTCGMVLEHARYEDPEEARAIQRLLEATGGIDES